MTAPMQTLPRYDEERATTATLCRMLGHQGVIGMFGHVSVRVPGTDHVLISPGAGSDKTAVRAQDIFVFHVDGEILGHPGHEIPLEWRIHTQVHRDRPEAMCVIHLHAPHATTLGIANVDLQPVFLHGTFLHEGVPTWNEPRLVVNDDLAARLSAELGGRVAVQMRGHGTVIAGSTPEAAFFYATFLEENAAHQTRAAPFGGATAIPHDDAVACARGTINDRLLRLLWAYHARKAQ
jgi:ribulose-5-phosphate 4-epimerase/fuculose-1-phosphate aldolase